MNNVKWLVDLFEVSHHWDVQIVNESLTFRKFAFLLVSSKCNVINEIFDHSHRHLVIIHWLLIDHICFCYWLIACMSSLRRNQNEFSIILSTSRISNRKSKSTKKKVSTSNIAKFVIDTFDQFLLLFESHLRRKILFQTLESTTSLTSSSTQTLTTTIKKVNKLLKITMRDNHAK